MEPQQNNRPSPGDVLITTETGLHFVSVVPYPHRLSFKDLDHATNIAMQWAQANHATAWRKVDGQTFRLTSQKRASAG